MFAASNKRRRGGYFVRDTHSVALTPDGEAMLGLAQGILDANERARRYFAGSELRGRVRFGASEDFVQSRLPEVLREFTRVHPAVDLELTVGLSGALLQALDTGELDLVLAKRRPGEDRGRLVRREKLVWVGSNPGLAAPERPLPLILYPQPSISRAIALEALERAGRSWRIVCTSSSFSGLNAAALAGLGVTVQADGLAPVGLTPLPLFAGPPGTRPHRVRPCWSGTGVAGPSRGACDGYSRQCLPSVDCRSAKPVRRDRMAEDFAGKVAVVTGGGNGIGAATCRAFAVQGARVAVLDRDAAAAERVAGEIAGRGGNASAYRIDVADRAAFNAAATEIAETAGGIDILVNGAGTTVRRMIPDMSPEDWDRVIAVNLTGAFNGIQAVLPYMRRRGGGAIVNVASIAGQRISFGGTANYSASKAGLLGLTRHAAYELAPDGIRVNAVCPGPTATAFGGAIPSPEAKATRAQKIPLGRMCEPEDIADPILFLAGPAARMITGVALTVDGGVLVKNDTPYEEYFRRR